MPRKWGFRLEPNNNWFDAYADHQNGPDISIITDTEDAQPNVYLWSSPHFDQFILPDFPSEGLRDEQFAASEARDATMRQLFDRAAALKALFDGAFTVGRRGHYHPMGWSALFELPDERRHNWEAGNPAADPFDRKLVRWEKLSAKVYNAISDAEEQMIYTARYDPMTEGMLRLLGCNGPTFVTLHNLLDTLNTGGWKAARVAESAKVDSGDVFRILATANNYGALGHEARHGDLGQKAYKDPMPLKEAQRIVLTAIPAFVRERAELVSEGKI